MTVSTLPGDMQKSKFGRLQQWIRTGEHMRRLRKCWEHKIIENLLHISH